MKKSAILLLLFTFLSASFTFCQEALFNAADLKSPEINADKSVTFRFFAPKADSVLLTGDFLPTEKQQSRFGLIDVPKPAVMIKDDKGVWFYTTANLNPELYSYSFTVDGLRVTDPNNPFLIRDVASVTNVFIVGGSQADLAPAIQWSCSTSTNQQWRLLK